MMSCQVLSLMSSFTCSSRLLGWWWTEYWLESGHNSQNRHFLCHSIKGSCKNLEKGKGKVKKLLKVTSEISILLVGCEYRQDQEPNQAKNDFLFFSNDFPNSTLGLLKDQAIQAVARLAELRFSDRCRFMCINLDSSSKGGPDILYAFMISWIVWARWYSSRKS